MWISRQGAGEVGERPQGYQRDLPGIIGDSLDDRVDRVPAGWHSPLQLKSDVAHTVVAVDELGGFERSLERRSRTRVNRHRRTAQLHRVEGVLHRLIEGDIAGDDGDGLDLDFRILQRHHERYCIVGGGVGVNQQSTHGSVGCEIGRA